MSNSSIWPIDRTQSGITNPDQSGLKGNSNEGVFHIPQSSRALPSDGLVSYSWPSLGEGQSYRSAEADWAA